MKPATNNLLICTAIICLALVACNSESKSGDSKTDTTKTVKVDSPSQPDYDTSMDAPGVAGYPAKMLVDSLNMKMYEFTVNPGDSVPMHTHPDHAIYVLEGGILEVKGKDGKTQLLDIKAGMGLIFGREEHSAINTGRTTVKLLIVHVYRPRG